MQTFTCVEQQQRRLSLTLNNRRNDVSLAVDHRTLDRSTPLPFLIIISPRSNTPHTYAYNPFFVELHSSVNQTKFVVWRRNLLDQNLQKDLLRERERERQKWISNGTSRQVPSYTEPKFYTVSNNSHSVEKTSNPSCIYNVECSPAKKNTDWFTFTMKIDKAAKHDAWNALGIIECAPGKRTHARQSGTYFFIKIFCNDRLTF